MNTIKIDVDSCSGCGTCVKACFVDVLRWNDVEDKPVVAYPEDCVHCNACELACPTGSIEVLPDFEHMHWPTVV